MGKTIRVLMLLALLMVYVLPTSAQEAPHRPAITPQNASQLSQLAVLGRGKITDLLWSPDGDRLVVVSTRGLWIYDAGDFEAEPTFAAAYRVNATVFNADSTELAFATKDGIVHLWNLEQNRETSRVIGFNPLFDPANTLLVFRSSEGQVECWNTNTGQALFRVTMNEPTDLITASPATQTAVAIAEKDKQSDRETFTVWDLVTGQMMWAYGNADMSVDGLVFSPDGSRLAVSYREGSAFKSSLWNGKTGSLIARYDQCGHREGCLPVFSPDSATLKLSFQGTVKNTNISQTTIEIVSAQTGILQSEPVVYDSTYPYSYSVDFHPVLLSDSVLAIPTTDILGYFTINLWAFSAQEATLSKTLGERGAVIAELAYNPARHLLASWTFDQIVHIWDIDSSEAEVASLFYHEAPSDSGSRALTFSPDGQQIGIVGSWNNASIWDVSSGTELHRQYFPELRLYGLAFTTLGPLAFSGTSFNYFDIFIVYVDRVDTAWFRPICMHNGSILSPSEELVAIGGEHCDVGIWRWKEDTQVASLELSHEGCGAGTGDACYSSPIAFNASESRLATSWTLASKFSYIALWDTESGQNLAIVDDAQTAAFSPDGTRLVIGGVLGLLVLDAETGEEITSTEEQFFRLAYSPNGRLIAASDRGGPVRLLDADNLTEAGTLSSSTAERSPIVFSPNSQLLATISADTSQLQLWDVSTQKMVFALDDPNLHALNIAFSPDGTILAASFDDQTVRLWGVDAVQ